VELSFMERRTATNVVRAIRDKILFRQGAFLELRSDHAAEFMGRAMAELAKSAGFHITTTGGYSPTGNATMERFWAYLGTCLQSLNDEQYHQCGEWTQRMAWGWNSTRSRSLDVAPFNVMTGQQARQMAGTIPRPRMVSNKMKLDLDDLRQSATAFIAHAKAYADYHRKVSAAALTSKGRKLRSLKIGDLVKIFCPPSAKEAKRRGRKVKHLMQWRGPYKVVETPSPTSLKLEHLYDRSKKFQRYVANVRRWTGKIPSRDELEALEPAVAGVEDIKEDDFLFARAATDSDLGELVKVQEINDATTTFQVWGTTMATAARSLPKAIFHPAYVDSRDDKTILSKKRPRARTAEPFTWSVPTEDLALHIMMHPAEVTKAGRLTKSAMKTWTRACNKRPMKVRRYK
jgi:hypothetical protein